MLSIKRSTPAKCLRSKRIYRRCWARSNAFLASGQKIRRKKTPPGGVFQRRT
jgi:hypothetical protein